MRSLIEPRQTHKLCNRTETSENPAEHPTIELNISLDAVVNITTIRLHTVRMAEGNMAAFSRATIRYSKPP